MGQLIPNVPITYETVEGVTYAKQEGVSGKIVVGYKYDYRTLDGLPLEDRVQDSILWGEIRRAAKTHEGLKAELERVIMFYQLIKTEGNISIQYHPV